MKKLFNNWWKITVLMIVCGMVLCFVGWQLGAFNNRIYFNSTGLHIDTTGSKENIIIIENFQLQEIKEVDIDVVSVDVRFIASDHNGFKLNMPSGEGQPEWSFEDGKLSIKTKTQMFSFDLFDFSFGKEYFLDIYYTELTEVKSFDSIRVKTVSGDIQMVNKFTVTSLSLNSISGDLDVLLLNCDTARLDSTSGNIDFSCTEKARTLTAKSISGDVKAFVNEIDKISLDSTSGNVRVVGSDKTKSDIKAKSISGDVVVENFTSTDTDLETTSGNIRFAGKTENDMSVKSVSGDITLSIADDLSNYRYELSSLSGRISIDGMLVEKSFNSGLFNQDAIFKIYAKTMSGNITIISINQ